MLCFLFSLSSSCVFVYPMMPVSLDCPFLIEPSVFSIVYEGMRMNLDVYNSNKNYQTMHTGATKGFSTKI